MCKILSGGGGNKAHTTSTTPKAPTTTLEEKVAAAASPVPKDTAENQAAVEADRAALLFGTDGLGTLTTRSKRGRNFAAGVSTAVSTLGVKLGQ